MSDDARQHQDRRNQAGMPVSRESATWHQRWQVAPVAERGASFEFEVVRVATCMTMFRDASDVDCSRISDSQKQVKKHVKAIRGGHSLCKESSSHCPSCLFRCAVLMNFYSQNT